MNKTDQRETAAPAVGTPVDQRVGPLHPKRVQLSRAKGWRMPPNTVKVDRTTKWGNPFVKHGDGVAMDRALAVDLFTSLLAREGSWWARPMPWPKGKMPAGPPTAVDEVKAELRGKNLACWCPLDGPCHADVLLALANPKRHNAKVTG